MIPAIIKYGSIVAVVIAIGYAIYLNKRGY